MKVTIKIGVFSVFDILGIWELVHWKVRFFEMESLNLIFIILITIAGSAVVVFGFPWIYGRLKRKNSKQTENPTTPDIPDKLSRQFLFRFFDEVEGRLNKSADWSEIGGMLEAIYREKIPQIEIEKTVNLLDDMVYIRKGLAPFEIWLTAKGKDWVKKERGMESYADVYYP